MAALAAFWRPDVGAIAALAAAATLWAAARRDERAPGLQEPHARGDGALVCLAVAAAGLIVLYAPFLVAAGPGTVWDALVVQASRDGEYWRLPFGFGGGDAKDFVTWLLPFVAVVTSPARRDDARSGSSCSGSGRSSTTRAARTWSTPRGC